jgi:hypothetical protein
MDLRESFLAHKPLKLTWSAPLLFDPVTGAPLTLRLRRQNQNGASFEILATNGPKLWIGVSVP